MTYPLKFREKVFEVKKKEELTIEATSKRFHVGENTLYRWQRKIEPCDRRNKPATKIDMEILKEDVAEFPDNYQRERAVKFGVCQKAICLALRRLNITNKKNSLSSKS